MAPDADRIAGGQAERTALSWSRTLLALAALTAFISAHAAYIDDRVLIALIGTGIAAILAIMSSVASRRVWAAAQAALEGRRRAARPVGLAALSVTATALAAISLGSIAWTNTR